MGGLLDAEDEQRQADSQEDHVEGAQPARGLGGIVRMGNVDHHQGRDSDRDVEPEHPAPGRGLGQHASEQRSEGQEHLADARVHGHGSAPPRSSKVLIMMAEVAGIISAAPIP